MSTVEPLSSRKLKGTQSDVTSSTAEHMLSLLVCQLPCCYVDRLASQRKSASNIVCSDLHIVFNLCSADSHWNVGTFQPAVYAYNSSPSCHVISVPGTSSLNNGRWVFTMTCVCRDYVVLCGRVTHRTLIPSIEPERRTPPILHFATGQCIEPVDSNSYHHSLYR
jgi:hypothetical protein